ncbi:replication initiation factor domain-containing protein [bacterium]|nr:replication initiation factor domain-containing protein [bacterium]
MIEFIIDYFRVTVHGSTEYCVDMYNEYFEDCLGSLSESKRGAKGYQGAFDSSLGFQLKHTPGANREYCTFEFPGQACKAIPPELLGYFYTVLRKEGRKINVNRIDLAFDGVKFTPLQLYDVILKDEEREKPLVRSLTQRDSLDLRNQPLKVKEDESSEGRETCYFGSRSSERYLRLYNKRGPNRLEVEYKGDRASLVANDLFRNFENTDHFYDIAISHLRDFIDIDIDWWWEFINDVDRAYGKIHRAKEVSLTRKKDWLINQVAPSVAAVNIIEDGQFIVELISEGRKRMYESCPTLLGLFGKGA